MRILMVIDTLAGGGAEHIFTTIACALSDSHQVDVLVFQRSGVHLQRLEAANIRVAEIRTDGSKLRFFARVREHMLGLRPNVVLSFLDTPNLVSGIALLGTTIPLVLSVRADHRSAPQDFHQKLKERLLYFGLRRCHSVIAVSEQLAQSMREDFPVARQKLVAIHNGLDLERLRSDAEKALTPAEEALFLAPTVLAIGRLAAQKDYPTLFRAFAALSNPERGTRLLILGAGPDEAALKSLAQTLGIGDRVHLLGFVEQPARFLRRATLYVMSSLYEGYPNALAEAMFVNGCCVSTDCPTGPSEIIDSGVNGLLVPMRDSQALASAMESLLSDSALAAQFRRHAREAMSKRTVAKMVADYLRVLESAARGRLS